MFGYTLLPPSLTPSVWPSYTATPLVTLDSASLTLTPIALYLRASGPTCYETPIGSLICLGQVYNGLQVPVEQVVITVQLHSLDGQALGSGDAFLARTLLPAGLTGPYRILFDRVPEGFGSASASVRSGQLAENTSARYADLRIREIAGTFTNDQYQVSLSIRNESPAAVWRISVTMMLFDKEGRVTGFRQVDLDDERQLRPGESLAMTIKAIPQGPNTVAFSTFAEGQLAPN
ncbi:MAG: hypothetical protein GXY36_12215 [Chloroflexi bacterium]|nr:hypothetical protein [Chloroflexota bacterium]